MINKLSLVFCAVTMMLSMSPQVAADSKTLPGHICDPTGNSSQYDKQSGHVRNTTGASVLYWCPIIREDTTNAPILTLRLKVDRPAAAADFTCSALSHRANGTTIETKSRITSQPGMNTLVYKNLTTVANGMVNVVCELPPQARIVSLFWDE